MAAPKEIVDLVERFESNLESYKSGHYNETQVRREFVDPFFKALGWDIDNEQGFAEAYKDVIHEDAVKVGTTTKAPDYSFRIGGQRKFFLEAKKPSVDIKDDIHPAFQLRRYAWTMKLPLSILTDFEEFAVYDCSVKPDKIDKASNARILYLNYKDYLTRWDEIAGIFSKNAVMKGSFDRYAADKKSKRGTTAVDVVFLEEIAGWREILARNIALRNSELSTKDLNYAVQAIVDRIVFLRICEDRGIERSMRLQDLLNGERVYPRLCEFFRRADERYNSGIFHFEKEPGRESPDTLTLSLNIDDKPLKEIIKRLYYPDSPYEFSVLPAEILGQVYEQFLGKVIRLTEGHHAVVEDKPEVKKAGGVKYTPAYIVEYIVRNTLGPTLKGKRPPEVVPISVLDPACGSGSFLIVAYQYLMDLHRDWYTQNLVPLLQSGLMPSSPEIGRLLPVVETGKKGRKKEIELPIFQGRGGEWRLTTAERKRILLNNIYGVDIDRQAVEVTKLSLLLRVLEGENEETISKQLTLFQERALPDLSNNIKCGNSLIGWDILKDNPGLTQEEIERINPFDWEKEFPDIMHAGGFHAVIGNPPYVRMEGFKELKEYLKANYASHDERSDLYVYFLERAHKILKIHGQFGMIVSNKFLRANYGKPLRVFLNQNAEIKHIIDFAGLPVFLGATVRTIILLTFRCQNGKDSILYSPPLSFEKFLAVVNGSISVEQAIEDSTFEVAPTALLGPFWNFAKQNDSVLLNRLSEECTSLKEYCNGRICMGVKSGLSEAFVIDEQTRAEILKDNPDAEKVIKPFLNGRDVRRYYADYKRIYCIYTYHGINIDKYLSIKEYLKKFKDRLQKRATQQEWYELQQPQYNFANFMDGPKIIFPDIAKTPRFALDETGYYSSNTTYFLPLRDLYLLGLLNSSVGRFYFEKTCAGLEGKNALVIG